MAEVQPNQLKVTELKEELSKRKLPTSGRKAELVARLEAHLQEEAAQQVDVTEEHPVEAKAGENTSTTTSATTTTTTTTTTTPANPNTSTSMVKPAASTPAPTTSSLSDLEKMKKRAERFNIDLVLSEDQKKQQRAQRFGGVSTASSTVGTAQSKATLEENKLRRAQRFGLPIKGSTEISQSPNKSWSAEEEEKKRKRLERFNPVNDQKKQKLAT